MGGGSYSDALYTSRLTSAATTGKSLFSHTDKIYKGAVKASVNEKLDPSKKNSVGKIIRESFDSADHPDSVPVAILFDVTGSMSEVPKKFISKLGNLMKLLVKKGYLLHPQILFGAIGDATCDTAPLQIGQFESSNEIDEALSLVYLERGGGGHITESYELGMYYMARHTDLDSLNKRGKKGYLFMMGDEIPYPNVKKSEVAEFIGDTIQDNIPTPEILAELRNKYEVYWILPGGTSNYDHETVNKTLQNLFGQNLLRLPNADDVCELIASTIGLNEGYDLNDITTDLVSVGADAASVTRAVAVVKDLASKGVAKAATVSGGGLVKAKKTAAKL